MGPESPGADIKRKLRVEAKVVDEKIEALVSRLRALKFEQPNPLLGMGM